MDDKNFDNLIKNTLGKEVLVTNDLDRKTRLKMNKVNEKKAYRITSMLIIINILIIFPCVIYLWQFYSEWQHRLATMIVCSFLISLFLLFGTINKQTYLKKEDSI